MRTLILLLALSSLITAADRKPFRVTCRPVFVANTGVAAVSRCPGGVCPISSPVVHCVTIDGVDWDLDKLRAEYRRPWTWPGMTEQSLRNHLANEHNIKGIDQLSFDDIRKIHAVIHEREQTTKKLPAPPAMPASQSPSRCPGGVCPSPGAFPQTWSRRRGLFNWR